MKTTSIKQRLLRYTTVFALAGMSLSAHALKVGDPAPDFALKDGSNIEKKLSAHKGSFVVLEWLNHGCPFVKKHYESGNMQALQKEFKGRNVVWYSVVSSAAGEQGHMSPTETLKAQTEHKSEASAVLIDADGKTGKAYDARTTPHMFIVSPEGKVVYNGAIDDRSTSDKKDVAKATPLFKNALNAALTAALEGKTIALVGNKPYGCSVKYKN